MDLENGIVDATVADDRAAQELGVAQEVYAEPPVVGAQAQEPSLTESRQPTEAAGGDVEQFTEEDQRRLDELTKKFAKLDGSADLVHAPIVHAPIADTGEGWLDTPEMESAFMRWCDGEDVNGGAFDDQFIGKFCRIAMGIDDEKAARKRFLAMFPKYDRTSKPMDGYDQDADRWTLDAQKGIVREQFQVKKAAARGEEAVSSYVNSRYAGTLGMTEREYADAKANAPEKIVKLLVGKDGFYGPDYTTAREVLGYFDPNTGIPLTGKIKNEDLTAAERWYAMGGSEEVVDLAFREGQIAKEHGEPKTDEEKAEAKRRMVALIDRFEMDSGTARKSVEIYSALHDMRSMSDESRKAVSAYIDGRGGFTNKGDVDALIKYHQMRFEDARGDVDMENAAMADLAATARVLAVLDRRYGFANDGSIPNRIGAGVFNTMLEGADGAFTLVRGAGRLVRSAYSAIVSSCESDEERRARKTDEFIRDMVTGLTEAEVGGEGTVFGQMAGEVSALFGIGWAGAMIAPKSVGRLVGRVSGLTGKGMMAVSRRGGAIYKAGSKVARFGRREFAKNGGRFTIKLADGTKLDRTWAGKHLEEWKRKWLEYRRRASESGKSAKESRTAADTMNSEALSRAYTYGDMQGAEAMIEKSSALGMSARELEAEASRFRQLSAEAFKALEKGEPALAQAASALAAELPTIAALAANDYERLRQRDAYEIGQGVKGLDDALSKADDAEAYDIIDAAGRNVAFIAVPWIVRSAALGHIGGAAQQKAAKGFLSRLDAAIAKGDTEGALCTWRALQLASIVRGPVARVAVGSASMGTASAVGQAVENVKFDEMGLGDRGDVADAFVSSAGGGAGVLGLMEATLAGVGKLARSRANEKAPDMAEAIRGRGAFLRDESAITAAAERMGRSVDLTDLPSDPVLAKVELRNRLRDALGAEDFDAVEGQLVEGMDAMLGDVSGRKGAGERYAAWKDEAEKMYGAEFVRRVERAEAEIGYNPVMKSQLVRRREYADLATVLDEALTDDGNVDEQAVRYAFENALGVKVTGVSREGRGKSVRVRFGGLGSDGRPRADAGSVLFEVGEIDPKTGDGKYSPRWAKDAVSVALDAEYAEENGVAGISEKIRNLDPGKRAELETGTDVDGILSELAGIVSTKGVFYKSARGGAYEIGTGRVFVEPKASGNTKFTYTHETGHAVLQMLRDTGWLAESSGVESNDGEVESGGKKYLSREQLLEAHVKETAPDADNWEEAFESEFMLGYDGEPTFEGGDAAAGSIVGSGSLVEANAMARAKKYADKIAALGKRGVTGEKAKRAALRAAGKTEGRSVFRAFADWAFGPKPAKDAFSGWMERLLADAKAAYETSGPGRKAVAENAEKARAELRRRLDESSSKPNGKNADVIMTSAAEMGEKAEEKKSPPTPPTIEEKGEERPKEASTGAREGNAAQAERKEAISDEAGTGADEAQQAQKPDVGELAGEEAGQVAEGVASPEAGGQGSAIDGPASAPGAEGKTIRADSAEAPEGGKSASGATPAGGAAQDAARERLDRAVELITGSLPVDASLLEGDASRMLAELNGDPALDVADVMRGFGYELDAGNGLWVLESGDPAAWHGAVADRAVGKVLDGKPLDAEERMHLGLVVDETRTPIGAVAVRRDGRIAEGEEIAATIGGKPLPPGYSVAVFPANPSRAEIEAARRALSVTGRPERKATEVAKDKGGVVEDDGRHFLVTSKGKDGKERRRTLSAQHNIYAPYLLSALRDGGFPMPSIAVSDRPNTFGEDSGQSWTVVFGRRTVDPKADALNMLYSADAWTMMDGKVFRDGAKNLEEVVARIRAAQHGEAGRRYRSTFNALVERIESIEEAHSLELAGRIGKGRDMKRIQEEGERFRKAIGEAIPELRGQPGRLDEAVSEIIDAVQTEQERGGADVWSAIRDKIDEVAMRSLESPPADMEAAETAYDLAADTMEDVVNTIREIGDRYFEAKPERVVGTDEIAALVAPWHYNGRREDNEAIEAEARRLGIPVFHPKAKPMLATDVPDMKQREKGIAAKGKAIEGALDRTDARFLVTSVHGIRRWLGDKKADEILRKAQSAFDEAWEKAKGAIRMRYAGKPGARPKPTIAEVERNMKPLNIKVHGVPMSVHFAGDPNGGGRDMPRIEIAGEGASIDAGLMGKIRKGVELKVGDLMSKAAAWMKTAHPEIWNAPVTKSEPVAGEVVEVKAALKGEVKDGTPDTVLSEPVRTDVDTTRGRTRGVTAAAVVKGGLLDRNGRPNADRRLGISIFSERLKDGKAGREALVKDVNAAVADLIAAQAGWYDTGTFDAKLADELRTRWSVKNNMVGSGTYDGDFYRVYALFGDPKLNANDENSVLGKAIAGFVDSVAKKNGKGDAKYRAQVREEVRQAIADALSGAYKRFSNVVESRVWADRTGLGADELKARGVEEIAEASERSLFRGRHGTSEKASDAALGYWREEVARRVDGIFGDMKGEFRRRFDEEVAREAARRAARAFMRSNFPTKIRSLAVYDMYLAMVSEENKRRKKDGKPPIKPVGKEEALAYFDWERTTGLPGDRRGRKSRGGRVRNVSLDREINGSEGLTLGDSIAADDRDMLDAALDAADRAESDASESTAAEGSSESAGDGGREWETGDSQYVGTQTGAIGGSSVKRKVGKFDDVAAAKEEIEYALKNNGPRAAMFEIEKIIKQFPPKTQMELIQYVKNLAAEGGGARFLVTAKGRGRRRRGVDELMAEAAGARLARARLRPSKGGVKVDADAKVREWLAANAKSVGVNEADRDAWCDAVMERARLIASDVESRLDDKASSAAVIRAASNAATARGIAGELLVGYALGSDTGYGGGTSAERAKAAWDSKRRKAAAAARGIPAAEIDAAIGAGWTNWIETLGREGNPYKDGDGLAAALIAEFSRRIRERDRAFATMSDAELMGDVRVRAELARTVAGWLEHSARELTWGDLRTDAERISARLQGAAAGGSLSALPTFREAHELVMNHADRLAQWLEGRSVKKELAKIEDFIDENIGGASRENQQERLERRNGDPVLQAYWSHVKKAMRMTSAAADKRLREINEALGTDRVTLEAEASANPDEAVRMRHDMLMEAHALLKYGGLKERKLGEIMDVFDNEIAPDLGGAAEAFAARQRRKAERQEAVRSAFVKELSDFMREHGVDQSSGRGAGASTSFLMHNVPDLFRRLQMYLHEGSAAYEWVEGFRRDMSLGHLAAHEFVATWEAAMRREFKECFKEDFERKIGELQRKREDFDRFSRTGWYVPEGAEKGEEKAVPPDGTHPLNAPTKLSLENLLYIRAAIRQSDMVRNNQVWGRDAAYIADLDETLRRELGAGADRFINWLTDAYARIREQLEPIAEEVTGMRILSPAEEYCPLAFIQPSRSADTKRFSVNPFPSFLTRRVNHDLSRLDETQGACRMFEERLQQAGHYVGFAKVADEVAGILDAPDVQTAYAQLLGKRVKNDVWSQLSDAMTGGRRDPGILLNGVRNFVTASSLFGNFASSLKQLEGIGGWAAEMGLVPWLKGLVSRRWNSSEIADAWREVEAAGIFRTRGDEGLTEAMATLMDGLDGDAPRTRAGKAYKWYKRHGMDMTRLMDRIASSFMAGQHLAFRRRFYEENGFTRDAATRAAVADVDYAINETQTSGRPEFLHVAQRSGPAGKILAQFAGPRFVRWGMEVEAFHRAFVMGDKGAKRKLLSRMVALHLVCGSMFALAGTLGRILFGTKAFDEDEEAESFAYDAVRSMAEGPLSGWFVIGSLLDAGLVSATSPEGYHGMTRYEVPLFSKLGNLVQASSRIWKDVAGCMEWGDFDGEEMDDIKKQLLRLVEMLFPASRNVRGAAVRLGAAEADE